MRIIIIIIDFKFDSQNDANRRDSYGVYDDDEDDDVDSPNTIERQQNESQLSSENNELKVKTRQLERQLKASLEKYEDLIASIKERGVNLDGNSSGKDKDRDSGIVITQEIKNLMDSYKDDSEGGVEIDIVDSYNFTNVVENLSAGITGPDDVEKYKKLCVNLVRQLKELGNRFGSKFYFSLLFFVLFVSLLLQSSISQTKDPDNVLSK